MQFRKLMLILTFTVSIIFVTVIGSTYAYYVTTSGSVSGTTGTETGTVTVVFADTNSFNYNVGIPISFNDRYTKAMKVNFSLYPNSILLDKIDNDIVDVYISADLVDVEIDSGLKVSDFKYYTICNIDYSGEFDNSLEINSGTGTDFNAQSFNTSRKMNAIELDTTLFEELSDFKVLDSENTGDSINCSTLVWVEESGVSQNDLMGKRFSANVEVNTIIKEK